ncbi:BglII/BstYI family type II restriction endonuclease [Rickettsia endosymbiont of Rhinocyllus conicus]|uniref:BglII/BstYI family type II restriction endonuclease n=1 Tax=Rickettsia endosymbiont of Rhinocyllus conicus TaxID=3066252 RepID=UPI003133410F
MGKELFPDFIKEHYEIHEWKHAIAILKNDFVDEWSDIIQVLKDFRFKKSWITVGGGEKSEISKSIDKSFAELGWKEKTFSTKVIVDENSLDSPTHKVDCYKNRIALEIEWNNKDPFFDRDLNNFRLLFDLRAISIANATSIIP